MKKKKTNKNSLKDLFAFGGKIMDIDTPAESVAKAQRNTQIASYEAMSDPTVAGLSALGGMLTSAGLPALGSSIAGVGGIEGLLGLAKEKITGKPYIKDFLPGAQIEKAAYGGKFGNNIEAEGGEIVETPGGMPVELQGPSHASGGIDMNVPKGTEVYSKRLKGEDGKTMANRKKKREKDLNKVKKLLEKDPTNVTLKKTLQRIQTNNEMLDQKDLSQMQFVKDLMEGSNEQTESFATGGYIGGYPNPSFIQMLMGQLQAPNISLEDNRAAEEKYSFPNVYGENNGDLTPIKTKMAGIIEPNTSVNTGNLKINNNPISIGITPTTNAASNTAGIDNKGFSLNNLLGNFTLGDTLGMASNILGPIAQMRNTVANRNATPPEKNAFKNFGDQALKKIQSQYGLLDDVRDNQLQNAELSRQGTINRNNNSARSINTQRALNLATDSSMNELKANIFAQYAQQVMGITAQEAAQMAQNDQMRMLGEDRRAERELQNTDNFFSNMAKNISDKYRSIGETGKALNQTKQRETTNEILKGLNPNFEYDPYTGKLIAKKSETLETERGKEANIKREGVAKQLNSVVDKIENILQKHNLNVDISDTESVKALQKILGVEQTGSFGDETIKALLKK